MVYFLALHFASLVCTLCEGEAKATYRILSYRILSYLLQVSLRIQFLHSMSDLTLFSYSVPTWSHIYRGSKE
ncbi:unnamed protein product [Amoebophrya sp. A25]|nr:unnamed protein product [Amoebophrya sp. A25]|eukprot:GSA25T00006434001.1